MSFIGSPSAFDAPRQPTEESSAKAEPLAKESTLQGIRSGISLMSSDLVSLKNKLGDKGAIYGILTDIADILDSSAIARHSDSPLETELKKINSTMGSVIGPDGLEQKFENRISKDKQSSLLSQINKNVVKSITENSMFKWFKANWGKLLLAGGILTLPYKYWEKLGNGFSWFMKQDWGTQLATIAAGFVGYQATITTLKALPSMIGALKDALVTGLILKWAGILPSAAGLAGKVVTGAGILAIALSIGKMIYDGWMGYHQNWDASGLSKAIGAALGGTGKGLLGAVSGAGKWAAFGFGIGMFTPFGPIGAIVGMIIGGAIGAIAGYFGGERIAKWMDGVGTAISTAWNDMGDWFTKKKSNYDTWAKDFGQRMATASDEWMTSVFNSVWGWMKSIWDFGKSVVNDPKGSFKKFKAGFTNAKKHSGPGAGKIKERLDSSGETSEQRLARLRKEQAAGQTTTTAPKIKVGGAETPSWLPTGRMDLIDGRKDMSGWNGLSGQAKLNSQLMANMFGGLRMTSGQRSKERQAKAMIHDKKTLDVYGEWFEKAKLSKKERKSAPGSNDRISAVTKIHKAGFVSNHRHGNAIDFSTPSAYIGRIPALRTVLEGAFPGSKLIEEGDHMHLAFEPGVSPDQLSAGMNKIHEGMGRGGFQGGPTYNINHHSQQNNVVAPQSTLITGDTVRDKSDK